MKFFRNTCVLATALLALGACTDLNVVNPNDPDANLALSSPGDVESLIAGSYRTWYNTESSYNSLGMILSTASFQHSAYPANFGMVEYSGFPRKGIVNSTADAFYSYFAYPWTNSYRSLAALSDGVKALDSGVDLGDDETRARAYAKFVQGLAHGTLALLYDQAFIVDETVDLATVEAQPASAVMEAALGYLDEAIALSTGADFEIPAAWVSVTMSPEELIEVAHSFKARLRANVARTEEERAAVDWDAVLADIDAGISEDWEMNLDYTNWWSSSLYYKHLFGWGQMSYWINGMADQSGNYQEWLAQPITDRHPILPGDENFLIITPDQRYPQGATLAAQQADSGSVFIVPTAYGNQWGRPDRGTHRWSFYRSLKFDNWSANDGPVAVLSMDEMNLLAAEAHYRNGDLQDAADLINLTRVAAGLNATDATGTNTSCVPKLPDGSCGDLLEMLKWEKRHETIHEGPMQSSWYFDGRGWGDLFEGTFLEAPIPEREALVLGLPTYTFGGAGGPSAAGPSNYDWQ